MTKLIGYIDKNGVSQVREALEGEVNEQQVINWHTSKPLRVVFSKETYSANLIKLTAHSLGIEQHPYLQALVQFVAGESFEKFDDQQNIYYYCEYVEEAHEAIIIQYGGVIEKQ
jgi:hypothetical protein